MSPNNVSVKSSKAEGVNINIRVSGLKSQRSMLMAHDADDERSASEDENPQMVELQARLLKAQDDLQRVQNEVSELWTKLLMAERELKVEQEINNIAWRFIPEEKRSDYVLEWPNRQHDWAESPPHASVTSFDWKDFTESD